MAKKYVYLFSGKKAEGTGKMRELLGGKGANLAEMINIGLPVPAGFTLTTEACIKYYQDGQKISENIEKQIISGLNKLEKVSGKKFGDKNNPLLISVRSGARVSMPGMMDTILNLGINSEVSEGLAHLTNNPRFAYDNYRRFIQMFSDVAVGIDNNKFEAIIDEMKKEKGVILDTEFNEEDLKKLISKFKELFKNETGEDFPEDPKKQLLEAIKAVFRSWENPRAVYYRRVNGIPSSWGTAVNIQEMVYGNMGQTSGTGVAFSRNPATGENKLYGEYLMNSQGEDVVAGIRTPNPISELKKQDKKSYDEFVKIMNKLEKHYRDMQDVEFTIENGKLFMLQTRSGKRTAKAALKIAVDLVNEKMLTEKEALMKIDPKQLDSLLHPQFDEEALEKAEIIGSALPASPGAASGVIAFTAEKAIEFNKNKKKVILVRLETSPEDIQGMAASVGILTARGGMTSHAAVVARGMGTACVSGCTELIIDNKNKQFTLNGKKYKEGEYISIDGSTGNIYGETIKTVPATLTGDFSIVMGWADKYRKLEIRTNADTPSDAKNALNFGAEGIGLCRTEHMFFAENRVKVMREMILATTLEERKKALDKLQPMQKEDFVELYKEMKEMPVAIRFLDPPLHEFIPNEEREIKEIAKDLGLSLEKVKEKISLLHEVNPMMGHRGLRLAITYPEIAIMQTNAVIEAALEVKSKYGYNIQPEIMIPLTSDYKEFDYVKKIVQDTANKIIAESKKELNYTVGTMIETPRATLIADDIAKAAEFFSFGTNDLTQMTYGFSRDDAGKFLDVYYEKNIFENDPFSSLDKVGVGKLVEKAVKLGKKSRPNLKIGICGEHGGDPSSIEFCHNIGLDYVSCSPFRIPIARLSAAQANIKNSK